MILKNYTRPRANKLSNLSIPDIAEPLEIKFLWVQNEDFNNPTPRLNSALHKHNFFELHFILEGEKIIADKNNQKTVVKESQAILFRPSFSHYTLFTPNLKRFSIAFSLSEETSLNKELSKKELSVFEINKKIINSLEDIFLEADKLNVFSLYIIQNKIFEIISEMMDILKIEKELLSYQTASNHLGILKAKQFIKDNVDIMLTCKDVAACCNLNEIYLNRIFKKETGETLLKYIHRKKTEAAEHLLKNSGLSLEKISEMLGFADQYYFNTFFKREVGLSPGTYRKSIISSDDLKER